MTSLRARMLNSIMRRRVKSRLAGCVTTLDARRVFLGTPLPGPFGARFIPAAPGGVAGEWVEAKAAFPVRATLFYLHGGGYIGMSPATHRELTGAFACRGFRVFAADYRLAPEHTFPAALDDAVAAWRALRTSVSGPIYAAGDSAGGGLTLALMLRLRDLSERNPDAACLFSPWTDLAVTGASTRTNESRDPLIVASGLAKVAAVYLAGADPQNPFASPLYGDFTGLPPLIFFVGDTEVLLDDTIRAAERARAAGVRVELRVGPDMPHVWPFLNRITPEGRCAMDEAAAFLLGVQESGESRRAPEDAVRDPICGLGRDLAPTESREVRPCS
ncbi:MAG TPA: alpha/beta hydrolase [Roseiarcus sp.]|nr:alpha/beta hydrolase [Roseiarcus sp.]